MNTMSASARIRADQYNGHDIISGEFERDGFKVDFKYSDGFFETTPKEYDPHIATMSCNLAYSSATVENGTDFSEDPKTIKDLLSQMGFEKLYASPAYTQEPTPDSVACAIGSRTVKTSEGTKTILSVTVRSANYEKEWASNVSIGKQGEAEGFAEAADQVTAEINQYLEDNGMAEAAASGNVVFWLSGIYCWLSGYGGTLHEAGGAYHHLRWQGGYIPYPEQLLFCHRGEDQGREDYYS